MFALLFLLLLAGPQQRAPRLLDGLSLPDGRVAEVLDSVPAQVEPRALGKPWPAWSDRSESGWGGAAPWQRWVALVGAAAARPDDPAPRAELAVLAHLQGRDGAAWNHLVACAREPGFVAALLPFLAPGVPAEQLGRSGALADGVLLSPALPPDDDPDAGLRQLAGKRVEVRELRIGSAVCTLTVSVDRDGLEVGVRHLEGGPARVRLLAPLPRGVERDSLLADWKRMPPETDAVEFVLDPAALVENGGEPVEHSLWVTFRPDAEPWPTPPLGRLRAPEGAPIVLASPRGDEPRLVHFATALAALFGREASVRTEDAVPPAGLEPLVLHVGDGPASERKLVGLIGLAEALALRAPVR